MLEVRRVVRMVEVPCWDCGDEKHNHKTRKAALQCKKKSLPITITKRLTTKDWADDLLEELLKQHEAGSSKAALARKMQVSPTTMAQRLWDGKRNRRRIEVMSEAEALARADMQQFVIEHGHWPVRLYVHPLGAQKQWIEYKDDGRSIAVDVDGLSNWAAKDALREKVAKAAESSIFEVWERPKKFRFSRR